MRVVAGAFVAAYLRGRRGRRASCPRHEVESATLLDLLLLEKAVYELRLRAANRPDWVEIPALGILELLEG